VDITSTFLEMDRQSSRKNGSTLETLEIDTGKEQSEEIKLQLKLTFGLDLFKITSSIYGNNPTLQRGPAIAGVHRPFNIALQHHLRQQSRAA